MWSRLSALSTYWQEYGLEGLAALSVILIVVMYVHNWYTDAEGTYSTVRSNSAPTTVDNSFNDMRTPYQPHTANDSRLELQSKYILEEVFQRPFYKIRPNFLRNEVTGFNLEIDLYNDDLKLAVEVQGDQHYKYNKFFHRNKEHFLNQRYRDEIKKMKCREKGICLIEVPYRVGEKKLRSYLLEQLRLEGFLL